MERNSMENDEKAIIGATYVDVNGKRVEVKHVHSRNVNWIDVTGGGTGSTDRNQLMRNYRREEEPGRAA
jgi:hypothetical protein